MIKDLIEQIELGTDVSINEHANVDGKPVKDYFCDAWPVAVPALQGMQAAIKNPLVKVVVALVIRVGDMLVLKYCPKNGL